MHATCLTMSSAKGRQSKDNAPVSVVCPCLINTTTPTHAETAGDGTKPRQIVYHSLTHVPASKGQPRPTAMACWASPAKRFGRPGGRRLNGLAVQRSTRRPRIARMKLMEGNMKREASGKEVAVESVMSRRCA